MRKIFHERTTIGSWFPPAFEHDEYAASPVVVETAAHYDRDRRVLVVDIAVTRGGFVAETLDTFRALETHAAEAAAIRAAVDHADAWQRRAQQYVTPVAPAV